MQDHLREGETLFAEGKVDEAQKCFSEIIKHTPENKDAFNNLGVIAFQRQDMEQALEYFTRALQIDPFHKDAILNFSTLLKSLDRFHDSIPILENAVEKLPDDQEINRLLNEARQAPSPKKNVAILCLPGLQSFLEDIVGFLKTRCNVRTCYSINNQEIESAVRWADIVWLEWANELAVHVTHKVPSLSEKQVICRIHSYEVLHGYLPRIQWSKVSKAIFVADHVQKIAFETFPSISNQTQSTVIHNGVNLRKFPFKRRNPGFNIGVVGGIDFKKNPSMWIEVLSRLMQIDDRYTLKIAGRFQELRYKYYMESIIPKLGLTNNIRFFGQVDDVPKWFETNDINYLLTTSPFESFGYSIAEAMAMGYRPLIHAFPSAEDIWPGDCVFGCTDELIQMVQDKQSYDSQKYRKFIEKKYPLQSQLEKIEKLLEDTSTQISRQEPSSELQFEKETQLQQQSHLPAAFAKYHRPGKTVIVTGIPRSGTSLFSTLLNSLDNAVCLNEILYDVSKLPSAFAEIRRRLIAGEPIPNRYDPSGNLATDTQGSGAKVENRVVQGVDENVIIGSKVNVPYLNQIQKILDYDYKVIAIVRDPVYAIGSWNSKKASMIPEAHVTDDDMHPRWRDFNFASDDKIERQAQIWNFYAHLIWNLRERIKIYTYELLTSDMEWVVKDVGQFLGLEPPTNTLEVSNQNIDSKYPKIARIKDAVKKYCPIKDVFAYSYLDYEEPGEPGEKDAKGEKCLAHSNKEQTAWSRSINYSRKPVLTEKGADSSHLVIAFGGIAQQLYLPPFEFFRATNSLAYSRILVRDFNQGWYHLGVDQNFTTFDAVLQQLRDIVAEMNPETICTVGTSAGGYAALAFGHFLKADCVHALAPQTFIDPDNRKRIGEKRWSREIARIYKNLPGSSWFYDLRNLLQEHNGKTVYNIHVCKSCQMDLAYAQHVENLPGFNIVRYSCTAHNIARYLKENDILAELLKKPLPSSPNVISSQSSKRGLTEMFSKELNPQSSKNRKSGMRLYDSHAPQKDTLKAFESAQTYLMFLGYPRSGHSLLGSLLDAHPNIIIAHELDALKFVEQGYDRDRLYRLIINNSQTFTKAGRNWTGYSYEVPNQWHGKFTELKVIGDKKGGKSVWRLRSNPDILRRLQDIVEMEVKLIHVIRNPFDNISTIFKKDPDKGLEHAIEFYFTMVDTVAEFKKQRNGQELYELSLESFIANPREQLAKLCAFLGVDSPDDYLEDCASIVFTSPRKTRETAEWSPDLIQMVQGRIAKYPFMPGYSYES